jgi:hypothetical protein
MIDCANKLAARIDVTLHDMAAQSRRRRDRAFKVNRRA